MLDPGHAHTLMQLKSLREELIGVKEWDTRKSRALLRVIETPEQAVDIAKEAFGFAR